MLLLPFVIAPAAHAGHASTARSHSGCAQRVALAASRLAYVGVVRRSATAFRVPGRRPFARFGRVNLNGARTVFSLREALLDRGCRPTWYRVQLPVKPNGVTGWVPAASVQVGTVTTRIVVDLSDRQLTFYRDGRALLRVPVGIGSRATPTPRGRFYVNQRVVPRDRTGPFGPAVLGVSAYSRVLTQWAQGGPIAVHGTNSPQSIGHAASTGCIRVRNSVMRRLFAATPAGTPVLIRS